MILSDKTIRQQIAENRLGVTPYDPALVQPCSLDVRLGRQFRLMRNSRATHIDPFDVPDDLMEPVEASDTEPFILHPGEFALAHTLETVTLPDNLVGVVNGKSSLGRLGLLIHATAGYVDAGFHGEVVLELSNIATLPIELTPGMKIGQLVFQFLDQPAERPYGHPDLGSKYQGQHGAVGSRYQRNARPATV